MPDSVQSVSQSVSQFSWFREASGGGGSRSPILLDAGWPRSGGRDGGIPTPMLARRPFAPVGTVGMPGRGLLDPRRGPPRECPIQSVSCSSVQFSQFSWFRRASEGGGARSPILPGAGWPRPGGRDGGMPTPMLARRPLAPVGTAGMPGRGLLDPRPGSPRECPIQLISSVSLVSSVQFSWFREVSEGGGQDPQSCRALVGPARAGAPEGCQLQC